MLILECDNYNRATNYDHTLVYHHTTYLNPYPAATTYEELKKPLTFVEDFTGVGNWVMRFPRTIYGVDLRTKHVFTEGSVVITKISSPSLE